MGRYDDQQEARTAFAEMFDAYGDAIFRFCMMKTSDRTLAEDLTQETFTRYWQALREGNDMPNARAYLYTIANNLVIDWYRRKKAGSLDALTDLGYEPVDTATPDTDREAEYREAFAALDTLDAADRDLVLLRYVEGMEPRDIATAYNLTSNVVSVRLSRAITRLRGILNP